MIRYALQCDQGHSFETWFKNSAAFDRQTGQKLVSCPQCGSVKVEKAIMAPRLTRSRGRKEPTPQAAASPAHESTPSAQETTPSASHETKTPVAMMSPQEQELRKKLKELRDHLTRNADYVGTKFPEEARKMHYGEIEHRSIFGEASADDAKKLHEEGIEFHALPILPEDRN
jgi:hypothetical protein